jgi:uncharacterized membrane protein HdeD (DUF308 family)
MHPYRTAPEDPPVAEEPEGTRLAMGVMAFTGGIQIAASLVHPMPAPATVIGASCFVAGIAWLRRHSS